MEFVFKYEGGYVNDPSDPGGETKYGISKWAYPMLNIKTLTKDDAERLYCNDYWKPAGCNSLPWPVDIVMFDTAVNCGLKRAAKFHEGAMKVPHEEAMAIIRKRELFYLRLAENRRFRKYKRGWLNRINSLRKYIL